jgi:hypothetical protein
MKYKILMLFCLPSLSFANCDSFFNDRATELNLGSISNNKCGANVEFGKAKKRMSFSNKKGRKDNGPTLRFSSQESGDIKVTQLLSKDLTTKHKLEYVFHLNKDCTELKEVIYKMPGFQADLNFTTCSNPSAVYTEELLATLKVEKLCSKFMVLMKKPIISPTEVSVTPVVPTASIKE